MHSNEHAEISRISSEKPKSYQREKITLCSKEKKQLRLKE